MFFFKLAFWQATIERAVRAAAISVGAVWVGSNKGPGNAFTLDYGNIIGIGIFAFVGAIVLALGAGAIPVGAPGGPSFVKAEELAGTPTSEDR